MSRFLSNRYAQLTPYTPGEQPREKVYIKLNTNESPYPPSPGVLNLTQKELEDLRLYSDPDARKLKQALARQYQVQEENVHVANGSDEALNFAFMAYAADGRGVAFADITYGFYPVFAQLHGIDVQIIPLKKDFSLCAEDYFALHKTIVIANPNAPTGLALAPEEIETILQQNPDSVVIVDEAYVDFGAKSCVPLTKQYENLLVVQTFSKSRSMAGARLGFAIGCADLIEDLERIRFSTNPYNVNRLTLALGETALNEQAYYDNNCREIIGTRELCKQRFQKLGFVFPDSKANFLFVKKEGVDGRMLYQALKDRGVLVRHFDKPNLTDYNRVTIGTQQEMDVLFECLEEIL